MDPLGAAPEHGGPAGLASAAAPCPTPGRRWRIALLAAIAAALALATAALPRIPQDPSYHRFADARTLLGVPNALDVLSNLAFLVAGVAGLVATARARFAARGEGAPWTVFFAAIALTAFGSASYHLAPSNGTLVWDRLPMAVASAALLAALLAERVGAAAGAVLLAPLALGAAATVVYWWFTETAGRGDLRPYVFAQALPLVAIPVVLALFPVRRGQRGAAWLGALGLYGVAKLAEVSDRLVWRAGAPVSGHTLKHLAAAAGIGLLAWMVSGRRAPSSHARGDALAPGRARSGP